MLTVACSSLQNSTQKWAKNCGPLVRQDVSRKTIISTCYLTTPLPFSWSHFRESINNSEDHSVTIRRWWMSYNVQGGGRLSRWDKYNSCNNSAGGVFKALLWKHMGQAAIYSVTSLIIAVHQKSSKILKMVQHTLAKHQHTNTPPQLRTVW